MLLAPEIRFDNPRDVLELIVEVVTSEGKGVGTATTLVEILVRTENELLADTVYGVLCMDVVFEGRDDAALGGMLIGMDSAGTGVTNGTALIVTSVGLNSASGVTKGMTGTTFVVVVIGAEDLVELAYETIGDELVSSTTLVGTLLDALNFVRFPSNGRRTLTEFGRIVVLFSSG
ncbi:hypothetical protein LTR28_004076 [Elasticomyces elasticus]|nr:hypothetical protein LTR28_004076 [Elasticomyces elasticus]